VHVEPLYSAPDSTPAVHGRQKVQLFMDGACIAMATRGRIMRDFSVLVKLGEALERVGLGEMAKLRRSGFWRGEMKAGDFMFGSLV
jgi:hypothetical protein